MATANEDLSRRFFEEVCNQRRLDVADEIIAADFVSHIPQSPPAEGPDGVKAAVAVYQEALDGRWDVQEMHSVDDYVFTRWIGRGTHVGEINGIAPTGNAIEVQALTTHRIAGGRIAEDWTVWDALGLLQQIGAFPAAV
jgi:predicted ester cyclase